MPCPHFEKEQLLWNSNSHHYFGSISDGITFHLLVPYIMCSLLISMTIWPPYLSTISFTLLVIVWPVRTNGISCIGVTSRRAGYSTLIRYKRCKKNVVLLNLPCLLRWLIYPVSRYLSIVFQSTILPNVYPSFGHVLKYRMNPFLLIPVDLRRQR